MGKPHFHLTLVTLLVLCSFQLQAHAAPSGPLVKHLSSLIKWTRSTSKVSQSDGGTVLQFEDGYLVETVVEGNEIGVVPHKIHVSEDGELFAVDAVNSNIVKITPPLSRYSRGRLVAGSFQGYTGHVDGKPSESRFNHPNGVTMDDKGNVYVADTLNLAVRKIGDAGVTTIAGGKSSSAGYRDGPSEDAKFSNDFDVIYVRPTCSLLVVDRGNAALRQISLNQDDCDYQHDAVSSTDVLMVIGAVLVGYFTCMLQQGFGPRLATSEPSQGEFKEHNKVVSSQGEFKEHNMEKTNIIADSMKVEPGWPSFGDLVTDLSQLVLEVTGSAFLYLVPSRFRSRDSKKALTPLKDSLIMPEDEPEQPVVQRQTAPAPLSETRHAHTPNASDKYTDTKPAKLKSSSFKDPSLSSKQRSSKHKEYAEFYGSGEAPPFGRSKTMKERTRHRQRDKSGEAGLGVGGAEPKPVEMKPVDYDNSKFNPYTMRNKFAPDAAYRY